MGGRRGVRCTLISALESTPKQKTGSGGGELPRALAMQRPGASRHRCNSLQRPRTRRGSCWRHRQRSGNRHWQVATGLLVATFVDQACQSAARVNKICQVSVCQYLTFRRLLRVMSAAQQRSILGCAYTQESKQVQDTRTQRWKVNETFKNKSEKGRWTTA